jgi:hypothetical protein
MNTWLEALRRMSWRLCSILLRIKVLFVERQKVYQPNICNFLELIEMLAKFDLTMQGHVRRIKDGEIHYYYVGHLIQNELIEVMATEVKKIITDTLKLAKYFLIIFDCTPDLSHKELMSLTVRFVDVSHCDIKVVEHFI